MTPNHSNLEKLLYRNAMTEEHKSRIQAYIRRNLHPTLRTEDGLLALEQLAQLARPAGVRYALAGGIAMHLYGFTRATTDVDVVADQTLAVEAQRRLSFGGESYAVALGAQTVTVDWIVRDDDSAEWYEGALDAAIDSGVGHPIIAPAWLVVLKFFAGRGKDHLDLLWLLRQDGLVDRDKIAALVREHMGRFAFIFLNDLEAVYLEADIMRAKDERDEGQRTPRAPSAKSPKRRK